ncbi:MAG: hypothetical protein P1V51_19730 [Deltaproteobacteria bacterium]|nr:hypothetical protein [Deltaproteobacteria bacterium]
MTGQREAHVYPHNREGGTDHQFSHDCFCLPDEHEEPYGILYVHYIEN